MRASKRGAAALATGKRVAKAPKSYAESALSVESSSDDESGLTMAAQKKGSGEKKTRGKSGRGYTSGYADPLKNYEGTYKSPAANVPDIAVITRPLDLAKHEPKRSAADNTLRFDDQKDFRPNLSPAEVLRAGSFGGTYFRPIASSATGTVYTAAEAMEDVPKEWVKGLPDSVLISDTYDKECNTFGVPCGGSLDMWESSGWINPIDPYGWFQWYCRFFQGRRCSDDERQIGRWLKSAGPKGRFRNQLIGKCAAARKPFSDASVSPVIRQTLQHWGYNLTQGDSDAYCKLKGWAK